MTLLSEKTQMKNEFINQAGNIDLKSDIQVTQAKIFGNNTSLCHPLN